MDSFSTGRPARLEALTRRRLLRLAGTAGLAAAAAVACEAPPGYRKTATEAPPTSATAAPPTTAPPLTTAPEALPPPAAATSRPMFCREAWGANPARPGGQPNPLSRMTIHHTAVTLGDNSNAPARLRQHQQYHQGTQGWIDIAYHVSVDRDGNLYQLRDPHLVGNTATSYDPTGHFLVVCEGNFDEEEVSEAQLDGAALAFAWAASEFGIPTNTLTGHRDQSNDTACPGASLYAHVTNDDLKARIDALLAKGPVELVVDCSPEAFQTVADIEAGIR